MRTVPAAENAALSLPNNQFGIISHIPSTSTTRKGSLFNAFHQRLNSYFMGLSLPSLGTILIKSHYIVIVPDVLTNKKENGL